MILVKTNEKILIWMNRTNTTGQQIAAEIGITRQAWSQKMRDNLFSQYDMQVLKKLGYNE